MLATVSDGGIERLDHLHVDDIDEDWEHPRSWVAAGLTAYALAVRMRPELGLDVTVALGFSLVGAPNASTERFETQEEFERNWTRRRRHCISSRLATRTTSRPLFGLTRSHRL
jgi:hypothetical protein